MILTVDIGNSNIVTAAFPDLKAGDQAKVRDLQPLFLCRTEADREKSVGDYERVFHQQFQERTADPREVYGIVISSVVPELNEKIGKALQRLTGQRALLSDAKDMTALAVKDYDRSQIGADRLIDLLAARELYGAPVLVFDLGTATTMSLLDEDGAFVGGAIAAGVQLQLKALHAYTAKLPFLKAHPVSSVIGKDTDSCMLSGAVIGSAAMIDGMIYRVKKELQDKDLPVVLTGGLSRQIVPLLTQQVFVEETLQLKGMLYWYLYQLQ